MIDLVKENSSEFDLPSVDLARFSEGQIPQINGEKFLVFFLGEELFAVSSKKVAEATGSLMVTALPYSPEWLYGVANLRGEVISVVNTPALLLNKNLAHAATSKFIILRSDIFEFGAALVADKISEIVTLPNKEIEFNKDGKMPFIFGKTVHKSRTVNLINTEKLLAALKI